MKVPTNKTQIAIALGVAYTSLLTGCNEISPSDSDKAAAQSTYTVKAIDGYLRNATVWLDLDGDYQLDSNEPSALSGEGGVANLNVKGIVNPGRYNVVVQATTNTVDEDTITEADPKGKPVTAPYMMSAPAGTATVTPLTTKVNLVLEKKKALARSSSSTSELTDEQVEVLKEAAVHEVAGDHLDPTLIMGDYVAAKETDADAARLAYEAKVLVESNQLPKTPKALEQAVENIINGSDPFDLIKTLNAVSEQTQKSIETTFKETQSNDDAASLDYNALEMPAFIEKVDDFTADNDGDGVPNALDAFPDDANEWQDSDGDGLGNNQADNDDDNDGIIDEKDAFPLNAKEFIDTDNDGIGNNADLDDDGDNTPDAKDAFPLDPSEALDTDGDGIGNNQDRDDDNDGVIDQGDGIDNDNGLDTTAIQFVRNAGVLYELRADDKYDDETGISHAHLFVGPILINENKGVTKPPLLVNPDGSLTEVKDDHKNVILTHSGWKQTTSYTLDLTTDTPVAHPTGIPESQLDLTLELVDLAGSVISPKTVPFLNHFKSTTAQFPPGSRAVKFKPVAKQDIYSLWSGSEVHVSTDEKPYHKPATTLDQLISTSAAGSAHPNLIYLGWNIGVELVADGTANYFMRDNNSAANTLVASGTWTRSTISGEELLQFTIPDKAINAFGDKWDQKSPTLFCSVFDDDKGSFVRMGSVEHRGSSANHEIYLFNKTAKAAILEQIEIKEKDSDSANNNGDSSGSDTEGNSNGSDSGSDSNSESDSSSDSSPDSDKDERPDILGGVTSDATDTDVINFIANTTALYEFDDEGDSGSEVLTVDAFILNGNIAQSQGHKVVLPDGTLGGVIDDNEHRVLTSSGWVTPTGYTLDISGSTAIAYPTNYAELVYSLGTPKITDLTNETISASTLPFWPTYKPGTAQFPTGSKALQFIPVANQDIYSLWPDSEVHMRAVGATQAPYHVIATKLDDLKSDTAATDPNRVKLIYLGWDIGVELVNTNKANFYKGTSLVDSTNWTQETKGGIDVIELTVTDQAIAAFGDRWHGRPTTILFAVNNNVVVRGTIERAKQANDFQVTMFNDTAYQAILNQVDISCEFTYSEGDSIDEFFEKVALYQTCSDTTLPAISDSSIAGSVLNRFNSDGLYRRQFFFADNTMLSKKKKFDEFGNKYTKKVRHDWRIKSRNGISYVETTLTDTTELNAIHVLLNEDGNKKTFAVYTPENHSVDGHHEPSETDRLTSTDATYAGSLTECESDSNDNTKELYDKLANACRTDSDTTATFNDITLGGSKWVIGHMDVQQNAAGTETVKAYIAEGEVTMKPDNTGYGLSLKYADESFTFGWKVNNLGQLVISPDGEKSEDINTITSIEDNFYTLKSYSQKDDGGNGEISTSTIKKI